MDGKCLKKNGRVPEIGNKYISFKNKWKRSQRYNIHDLVIFEGLPYICVNKKNENEKTPDNSINWVPLIDCVESECEEVDNGYLAQDINQDIISGDMISENMTSEDIFDNGKDKISIYRYDKSNTYSKNDFVFDEKTLYVSLDRNNNNDILDKKYWKNVFEMQISECVKLKELQELKKLGQIDILFVTYTNGNCCFENIEGNDKSIFNPSKCKNSHISPKEIYCDKTFKFGENTKRKINIPMSLILKKTSNNYCIRGEKLFVNPGFYDMTYNLSFSGEFKIVEIGIEKNGNEVIFSKHVVVNNKFVNDVNHTCPISIGGKEMNEISVFIKYYSRGYGHVILSPLRSWLRIVRL